MTEELKRIGKHWKADWETLYIIRNFLKGLKDCT